MCRAERCLFVSKQKDREPGWPEITERSDNNFGVCLLFSTMKKEDQEILFKTYFI